MVGTAQPGTARQEGPSTPETKLSPESAALTHRGAASNGTSPTTKRWAQLREGCAQGECPGQAQSEHCLGATAWG